IIDRNLIPQNRDGLWNLALLYLLVTVFIGVFDFLKSGVLVIFGQKIVKQIRMEMNGKLQRLGMQYYTKNSAAEITSRFNSDVENVNALFSEGLISMMIDCLKIVGIVISIALFSLRLGLLSLLLIPLISVITRNFQRKLLIAHTQNLKQLGRVNNHISESMKNIFMIKAYSKEEYMEGLYEKRLQDNFTTIERVNFYDSCYAPIIQLIRAAVISAVVLLSFGQQSVLGISLGMVAASIDLIANLFAPVEALGMELQSIQKGISGAKRIDEFLGQSEEEQKDRQITAEAICAPESTAAFAFEGVSFSYADAEKPVLSEITLTIEPGESVTFAGRTGVGKTTLFKLIMGLEKPTQGHITLGGVDVCKIPNDQKRRLLGYVEQNFSFVEGTVAQQISLDEEGITREQVEKALAFV
ncbi:MAG: ABC transporter ATP-binding protein, partial [Hungatella sp.]